MLPSNHVASTYHAWRNAICLRSGLRKSERRGRQDREQEKLGSMHDLKIGHTPGNKGRASIESFRDIFKI